MGLVESRHRALDKVFYPDSIAVVGVSSRMDNPGTLALRSIKGMGFDGPIYPVNPKYDEILGLICYPSVRDVPSTPDLVILAIPPREVPAAVAECAEVGAHACIINTAGFSETGRPDSIDLERRIIDSMRASNLRIVGPNCMGVYSSSGKIALFDGQRPSSGSASLVSQSGSFAAFLYLLGAERAIMFSKMVSSGNELDLNCADYLEYFADDPETEIIIAYLEEIREPRRFLDAAMRIKGKKPLLILQAGLTGSGHKAAASHTGAMSGSEEIWRAVVRQAGIIPVEDLADTVDVAAAFRHLEKPGGRRLCIISPPGGIAVNCADAAERSGLMLSELEGVTVETLSGFLPREGTGLFNPVDLGFGAVTPGNLSRAIKTVAPDANVDLIMVVAGAPAAREGDPGLVKMHTAEVKEAASEINKPVVVIGIPSGLAYGYMSELHWAGIPCYISPGSACRSLERFLTFHGI